MICERCGKSNIHDVSECAYCKAEMPKTSGGGGFADILSYKPAETDYSSRPEVIVREIKSEGISEADMQKLIKKSDKIIKSTNKNSIFGLVAVALCGVILIFALFGGAIMFSMLNQTKAELAAITDHLGISELDKAEENLRLAETKLSEAKTKLETANSLLAKASMLDGDEKKAKASEAEKAAIAAKTAAEAAEAAANEAKTLAESAAQKEVEGSGDALKKAEETAAAANEAKTAAGNAALSAQKEITAVTNANEQATPTPETENENSQGENENNNESTQIDGNETVEETNTPAGNNPNQQ